MSLALVLQVLIYLSLRVLVLVQRRKGFGNDVGAFDVDNYR